MPPGPDSAPPYQHFVALNPDEAALARHVEVEASRRYANLAATVRARVVHGELERPRVIEAVIGDGTEVGHLDHIRSVRDRVVPHVVARRGEVRQLVLDRPSLDEALPRRSDGRLGRSRRPAQARTSAPEKPR